MMRDTADSGGTVWHERLFAWSYRAVGREPPKRVHPWFYAATISGALAYLVCAVPILIVLNVATLPLGVFAEPIWRPKPQFRRLLLPGGIPVIAIMVPVFLAIALWHNYRASGLLLTLGPFLFTGGLGFLLLGACILFNRLHRRAAQRPVCGRGDGVAAGGPPTS